MCSPKNSACNSTEMCADNIAYLFREILVKVECCLYIVISNEFGNKTCIFSVLAHHVHDVYADENLGLFLDIVCKRRICSSKFSLKYSAVRRQFSNISRTKV